LRRDAREEFAGLDTCACAGRIEDDKLGTVALQDGCAQEVEGGGFDGLELRAEFAEGRAQIGDGLASTAVT
jgi:hypothetical protein